MASAGQGSRAPKRQRIENEAPNAADSTSGDKGKQKQTKLAKTVSDASTVDEDAKRIAARLVSEILDKYCENEKHMSESRQQETEQVKKMLEVQKAASEAQKAASDAACLAEKARLATLKFAFEHKLSLTNEASVPAPPKSTPESQPQPQLAVSPAQPHPAILQQLQSFLSAQPPAHAYPQHFPHPYHQAAPPAQPGNVHALQQQLSQLISFPPEMQ